MAGLYDGPATSALNEDAYINKLYDSTMESQKKVLQQGYDNSIKQLTAGQQNTQKQTSDYVKRAYVEGQRAAGTLQKAPQSSGIGIDAQTRLTLGNQQQANNTALKQQQSAADLEYERRRKLLADRYSAQIKQAQADNDMARAQALYEAAKAEEEQLRALRQSGAILAASEGNNTLMEQIAAGTPVQRDTTTPTWEGVDRNEESINRIYDAQLESARQQAQMEHDENMSQLEAQQRAAQRQTDEALNETYVDALKRNRNALEGQNASGLSSGTAMQSRLAREAGLMERLTELRRLQLGKDAEAETEKAGLVQTMGEAVSKAQSDIDGKRNQALYAAAEGEEQALLDDQKFLAEQMAKRGDDSLLRILYGLPERKPQQGGGVIPEAPKEQPGPGTGNFSLVPEGYVGQAEVAAYNYLLGLLRAKPGNTSMPNR